MDGGVAVVTGSGRGIGRAVARRLASHGMRVVVNDVGVDLSGEGTEPSVAELVAEELRAEGREAIWNTHSVATMDGAEAIVSEAIAAFGRIDLLVNNAGVMRDVSFLEMSEKEWDDVYDVNLKGVFACSRAAAPVMADQGGGRIINMASINAFGFSSMSDVVPTRANYAATKAGVLGFSWALAGELASHNITCNAVMPTASTRLMAAAQERRRAQGVPISAEAKVQRDPDTVARLVAGLASTTSGAISGSVFHVDRERVTLYSIPQALGTFTMGADMSPEDVGTGLVDLVDSVS